MRPATKPASNSAARSVRRGLKALPAAARQARRRGLALENLEPRTLMAVLPALLPDPRPLSSSNGLDFGRDISQQGNRDESAPSIAINRNNPLKMAASWETFDPNTFNGTTTREVFAAYSIDGGMSWSSLATPAVRIDPATLTNSAPTPFASVTDASVAFDRNDNLYLLENQHSPDFNSGEVILERYNFAGNAPAMANQSMVALWNRSDQMASQTALLKPVLAVDDNLPTYTDPVTNQTQTDTGSGRVYIAWGTDEPPPNSITSPPWTRNTVELLISNSQGAVFGPPLTVGTSHFGFPEMDAAPRVAISQGRLPNTLFAGDPGVPGGQVTVVFDDFGSAANASPPQDVIWSRGYRVSGVTLSPISGANFVTTTTVRGALDSPYPLLTAASPSRGIGPGLVLAADNTLGSFSPHQGRLYMAYTDRYDPIIDNGATLNPLDNTDIVLWTSDDGGGTWTPAQASPPGVHYGKVNDDASLVDGFSEAVVSGSYITGRAQWQAELSVDATSGVLVLSYEDGRWDASRSRSGLTVVASLDGGTTFSASTFADTPQRATDAVTNLAMSNAPIPTNQSGGNGNADAGVLGSGGIGDHQGLAVYGGRLFAAYSSNVNGGDQGTTRNTRLDIRVAPMLFASGPRIIASTMGVIKAQTVTDLNGNTLSFNNQIAQLNDGTGAAPGTPIVDGFTVTFDRPVDAATFDVDDVQVFYHDPSTSGSLPGIPVAVLSVTAVNNGTNTVAFQKKYGATQFLVKFAPEGFVGTYSYIVGPNIRDKFESTIATNIYYAPQNLNNLPILPPAGSGGSGNPANDNAFSNLTIANVPADQTILDINVKLSLNHTNPSDLVVKLIPPPAYALQPITLVQNSNQVNYKDATFDDQANAGNDALLRIYKPVGQLRVVNGKNPNGVWTLEIDDTRGNNTGNLISWGMVVTTRSSLNKAAQTGNLMDQNSSALGGEDPTGSLFLATAPGDVYAVPTPAPPSAEFYGVNGSNGALGPGGSNQIKPPALFPSPYDATTLPLMIPGPHVVRTFIPGAPVTTDNLVTDNTVSAIDVVFDRDMNPNTLTLGNHIVRVMGPTGLIPGPFSITADPNGDLANPDPNVANPRTYRINFLKPDPNNANQFIANPQSLSGAYSVTIAADVQSKTGDQVDTNLNAGLDVLRGTPSAGTLAQTYNSTAVVPIGGGPAGAVYTSLINVPDSFLVKGVTLKVNITYPNDPDLEATLIAPDGFAVKLFTAVGKVGSRRNFTNTVFDDTATTPIQNGGPPFFGKFNPQLPLSGFIDHFATGPWQLQIKVNAAGTAGFINNWSLTLKQPLSNSGLGEPVADRSTANFRIFNQDPTNPLASNTWTAVGPAAIGAKQAGGNGEVSGRVSAIAVDPSDPSGNTVYIGAPGGGIWKTTNFLTTSPAGPTYVPLLDNGPTGGLAIGSIAIFPKNNDPTQSVIFATTGEGDSLGDPARPASLTSRGMGFLRSTTGGATWELLDSRNNTLPFASRDHYFASMPGQAGVTSFKIAVDPKLTPTGDVIVYAALSDIDGNGNELPSGSPANVNTKGGLWRSLDSGLTWQQMRAGQATDFVLDLNSASVSSGNLQFLYAAFRGDGVYFSPNRGQVFNLMAGTTGDPLIQDTDFPQPQPVPVNNPDGPLQTPNAVQGGGTGRIVLAKPALTGIPLSDLIYQGWLYAAVVSDITNPPVDGVQLPPNSDLVGLYLTKDFGQTWTKIKFSTDPTNGVDIPTNDLTKPDYTITGNGTKTGAPFHLGNYDLSLAVDPNNANVIYLGGTDEFQSSGLVRVDSTFLHDPHAFFLDSSSPDGGLLRTSVGDGVTEQQPGRGIGPPALGFDPAGTPFLNLIRDPNNPFVGGATILVQNTASFGNDGGGSRWTKFDQALQPDPYANPLTDDWAIPTRGVHRIIPLKDPLTGRSRLIFGDDQGVYTAVANNDGSLIGSVGGFASLDRPDGNVRVVQGSRNGNLQTAQFLQGAAQPSLLAAQLAALSGFFYGNGQDVGMPMSDVGIVTVGDPNYGNLNWSGIDRGTGRGLATGQVVSQDPNTGLVQGGTVYQWRNSEDLVGLALPEFPGSVPDGTRPSTDTVQVDGVGRTFGMYQTNNGGDTPDFQWPFRRGYTFIVNPLNNDQILISSDTGRIFGTEDRGLIWAEIGNPGVLDGTNAQALAYGAPDPNGPGGVGNLNNFLYAGTLGGNVFVTFTGGGGNGNAWLPLSNGLQNDGTAIQQIITNPTGGSHEAYAVTRKGVYHMVDSNVANAAWQPITGNLFSISHNPLGQAALGTQPRLQFLTSLVADWRYVIPDDLANPSGPNHPMLYTAGNGGVYRSLDNGKSWTLFPDGAGTPANPGLLKSPLGDGGGLPNAQVTDLDLSLGNVDPTTGRPNVSTGSNELLATTYGRGSFAIRLAPIVFPNTTANPLLLRLDPTNPPPPAKGSDSGASNSDNVTNDVMPFITGLSEQSAFGNTVTISLFDASNAGAPVPIPVVNGTQTTHEDGRFSVQIAPGYFDAINHTTDGKKVILVQATNQSGTKGNLAELDFILDTTPPLAPNAPILDPASDTGLNQTDSITSLKTNLIFNVVVTPGEPPTTFVQLFRDNIPVGLPRSGSGPISDPGPVTDGQHQYKVQQTDLAGNVGPFSAITNVVVDSVAPNRPPSPLLDPADDSGIPGDNITNNRRPRLIGTAEPNNIHNPNDPATLQNNQIQIVDSAGNMIGKAAINPSGTYSVQPSTILADGTYVLRVLVVDVAGNVSVASTSITLTIISRAPSAPSLQLVAADDTGIPGDNITAIRQPRFQGIAQPGLNVQLIDDLGNIVGAGGVITPIVPPQGSDAPILVAPDGTFVIKIPSPLADASYRIKARVSDIAGNSAVSLPLAFRILTQGPATAPTLALDARDDTGVKGDNTTSSRRPRFVGVTAPGVFVDLVDGGGVVRASTTAAASGNFSMQLPSDLTNGSIRLQARVRDIAGNQGPPSPFLNVRIVTTYDDFNSDGKADLSTFRPSNGQFSTFLEPVGPQASSTNFPGLPGDVPLLGDFDGDGRSDFVVFRPSTATWYLQRSTAGSQTFQFGWPGVDQPAVGDYDGDGKTDFAIYRPTNGQWTILFSNGGSRVQNFGQANVDKPIPADYDGDGKTDLAVFRPTTSTFLALLSGGGVLNQQFGQPNVDVAISGDFDGDNKTDVAVYRPTTSTFLAILSGGGVLSRQFGAAGDRPVIADYDGDAKFDVAVYRPTTGQWLIVPSSGQPQRTQVLGAPGDIPLPAPRSSKSSSGGSSGGVGGSSFGGGVGSRGLSLNFGGTAANFGASNLGSAAGGTSGRGTATTSGNANGTSLGANTGQGSDSSGGQIRSNLHGAGHHQNRHHGHRAPLHTPTPADRPNDSVLAAALNAVIGPLGRKRRG